jgi:hypothetical protein
MLLEKEWIGWSKIPAFYEALIFIILFAIIC